MLNTTPDSRAVYEQMVLNEIQDVPLVDLPRMVRVLHFFKQELVRAEPPDAASSAPRAAPPAQIAQAVAIVNDTWASIPLDLKTAIYIAEDKELEYDV